MSYEPGDSVIVWDVSESRGVKPPFKKGEMLTIDKKNPGEGTNFISLVKYPGRKWDIRRFTEIDSTVHKAIASLKETYKVATQ